MKCYGITDKGNVRKANEDSFAVSYVKSKDSVIAVVCDGVGGAHFGELASKVSVEAFTDTVRAKLTSRVCKNPVFRDILQLACSEANSTAFQYSQLSEEYSGMGTTLVGAVADESGKCSVINVGDSRAYYISAKDRTIRQITNDHSYVATLVRSGLLSKEEAKTHPKRNVITRAIGAEPSVEADVYDISLKKGDMLVLCSDGLYKYISDEEMLSEYLSGSEPEQYCRNLISLTLQRGAGDNVTVISVLK